MKSLYIFATTERPDAYINAVCYGVEHLDISSVHVVVVKNEKEAGYYPRPATILGNISRQLSALSEYKYINYSNSQQKSDLIANYQADSYKKGLQILNDSENSSVSLNVEDLSPYLSEKISYGDCIFDVSALKKHLLIDVVAILLSLEFSQVYAFELKKKPSFNVDDIYHKLEKHDFSYQNLTSSINVQKSIKILHRGIIDRKKLVKFLILLAIVFVPLSIFWPNSPLFSVFSTLAMIASVAGYLFLATK